MDRLQNIELKNNCNPAKTTWPDWPDNLWMQLSGQIMMAGLARKWPDIANQFLLSLITVSDRATQKFRFFSQGHSIGQFVLDSHLALKRHFYRTFSLNEPINSYLIDRPSNSPHFDIRYCTSITCLFDSYLIETLYRGYKTPKPLY